MMLYTRWYVVFTAEARDGAACVAENAKLGTLDLALDHTRAGMRPSLADGSKLFLANICYVPPALSW